MKTDKQIFQEVFARMQEQYPHRDIRMFGTCVEIDGRTAFNTDGYNLLFNLQRLCNTLGGELL